jgi:amino-acid N-acetyltransferase
MEIRNATIRDVEAIHSLISNYAELDKMLFRSLSDIYENLQLFQVAEKESEVIGCCGLHVVWADLAEIKSLSVEKGHTGEGVGKSLVLGAIDQAMVLGLEKVFTLTLEPEFFVKIGFKRVTKEYFPMKVWSDCAKCSKQDHCDETALIYEVKK